MPLVRPAYPLRSDCRGSLEGMGSPAEKPLWQFGLDWLLGAIGESTNYHDRERARKLARGMRMVGERPPLREVGRYVNELWGVWRPAAEMVRETWRSVDRAKTSIGKDKHWDGTPLYVPDMLIEDEGLSPSTEERLAAVARDATDALVGAAGEPDPAAYLDRRRDVLAAMTGVQHLRVLRFGSSGLGFRDELNPLPARRPKPSADSDAN